MKDSIEAIWKEGFLNEMSLVAPKINNLYNQKSMHLIEKMKRMYRINLIALILMAVAFPVVYYFMEVLWQGIAVSVLLLLTVWYSVWQKRRVKTLDYGATSLDYLRSFEKSLNDALSRGENVLRFSYPLYFLIAMSIIYSTWNRGEVTSKLYQNYPDIGFVGSVPLFALIIMGVATLLIFYFSRRIYRWDIRLFYGRIFDKLKDTISEMERLKQES